MQSNVASSRSTSAVFTNDAKFSRKSFAASSVVVAARNAQPGAIQAGFSQTVNSWSEATGPSQSGTRTFGSSVMSSSTQRTPNRAMRDGSRGATRELRMGRSYAGVGEKRSRDVAHLLVTCTPPS